MVFNCSTLRITDFAVTYRRYLDLKLKAKNWVRGYSNSALSQFTPFEEFSHYRGEENTLKTALILSSKKEKHFFNFEEMLFFCLLLFKF